MPHKDPEARAAYARGWRARNRDRVVTWEREHRDERLVQRRAWHRANRDRGRAVLRETRAQMGGEFWAVYGQRLERGELDRLYAAQGGRCALCDRPGPDRGSGRLQIDHDHETAEPRGLLCKSCNVALGYLERASTRRDSDWIGRAVAYLADPPLRRLRTTADGPSDLGRAMEEQA